MKKTLGVIILLLACLYLLLLIPSTETPPSIAGERSPFAWNQDSIWHYLEKIYSTVQDSNCDSLVPIIEYSLNNIDRLLDVIGTGDISPMAPEYDSLENTMFGAGPLVGACRRHVPKYLDSYTRMRNIIKRQSISWDMNDAGIRDRLYRVLYGGRAAIEEIMLQMPADSLEPLLVCANEPSATPKSSILGVDIHSGDILVSRGGAPTSALIARGNDYPGNFSHVALVHVDENTHKVSIIESHIEIGVAVADNKQYMNDKKLRIMVLRLRSDLPELLADPLLPHKAAAKALEDATELHIAYDFEMDFDNHDKLFCSEVASAAYEEVGINLWMGISYISSPGTRSWLGAFGVKYFETQEPSDLEYDPQLTVVAEWRDPETLYKDHVDNAVIDAMLETADYGKQLEYDLLRLPLARLAKAYSVLLNQFEKAGPIPEGMSAESALRNERFSANHAIIKAQVLQNADEFRRAKGYTPPYWVLVKLAREAIGLID